MNNEIMIEIDTIDLNNITTKDYFQCNSINLNKINLCYQGITYIGDEITREKLREKRIKDIYPIMNEPERLYHKLLRFKTLTKQAKDLFYQFHSFNTKIAPILIHDQLRQNFMYVSPNQFTFLTREGIYLYNMISLQSKVLLSFESNEMHYYNSIISFDIYKYKYSIGDYKIALGTVNGELKIIDIIDYEITLKHTMKIIPFRGDLINCVQFSFEDTIIIISDNSGHIRLINSCTYQIISNIIYEDAINAFSYNHQLNIIAAVGDFQEVLLYDSKSNKLINKLKGHKDHGMVAKFNDEGFLLATGNQDIECRLWDMRKLSNNNDKEISLQVLYGYTNSIGNLDFLCNDRLVYYENTDYFHIYDINYDTTQSISFFGEVSGSIVNKDKEQICLGIMFPEGNGLAVYEKITSHLINNLFI